MECLQVAQDTYSSEFRQPEKVKATNSNILFYEEKNVRNVT